MEAGTFLPRTTPPLPLQLTLPDHHYLRKSYEHESHQFLAPSQEERLQDRRPHSKQGLAWQTLPIKWLVLL